MSVLRAARRLVRDRRLVRRRESTLVRRAPLLVPVAEALVFMLVFGAFLRLRGGGLGYLAFVLVGLAAWRPFARAVRGAASTARSQEALLLSFPVPLASLSVAEVGGALVEGAPVMVVFFAAAALLGGVGPPAHLVAGLAAGLSVQLAATLGVALLVTVAGALWRDASRALPALVAVAMFFSPVVYPTELVPAAWRGLYLANPMSAAIECYRWALGGPAPPPWPVLGAALLSGALLLAGAAAVGRWNVAVRDRL